jgi:pantoate--beta-alanine ligase
MKIFKTIYELQYWLASERLAGATIGFVPTMGALHDGHLTLVERANETCTRSVASIFVNPTQFNDPKDLERYPRMPEKDAELLANVGCNALFLPSVEEIYPLGHSLKLKLNFGQLDKVMEGHFRPGHFEGMATVVKRLLDIVQPHQLFMGQKDFQQLTIVREMLRLLGSPVELVMCPTIREADGLAKSSRNTRLTPEMRAIAPVIYHTLVEAAEKVQYTSCPQVQAWAMRQLADAGLRPEYVDIVDGITLRPVLDYESTAFVVACVAAWAGEVRLIDNLVFREMPTV